MSEHRDGAPLVIVGGGFIRYDAEKDELYLENWHVVGDTTPYAEYEPHDQTRLGALDAIIAKLQEARDEIAAGKHPPGPAVNLQ